jgi:hypothetical protein
MIISFTGTQKGMTSYQKMSFLKVIQFLKTKRNITQFNHGDCIGADTDAHEVVSKYDIPIHIYPGVDKRGASPKRAFCINGTIHQSQEYLIRNKKMVDLCNVLIACPAESTEQLRSGTWSTIRYAKTIKTSIVTIYPDGTIQKNF